MPHLHLTFLGAFQAQLDGVPLTNFHSVKVQGLLAYLALEADRPHPRETLATLFWPLDAEASARSSLRQALYELRKLLGDRDDSATPFLLVTRQTVQFNRASDYTIDVADFLASIKCGQLAAAAACYRGELLSGLTCESEPFEEWLRQTRTYFHNQAVDLFFNLTAQHMAAGELAQARTYAQRQLALEPWREEAHRQLMTALALGGERSAALAQYETCRRVLAEELGIEPEVETTTLYAAIKAGKLRDAMALPLPQPASTKVQAVGERLAPRHNLPPQPTLFIGRKTDLEQIAARLNDIACRLLTIVGPGGMGKTRLAIQAAQRCLDVEAPPSDTLQSAIHTPQFVDGVFFVALAAVGSPDLLVATIAATLDFTFYGSGDPRTQLLGHLRPKALLLILDNCEHLLDGIDLVSDLLATAPGVKVLATSREPLNLREEWLHLLTGMSFPTSETHAASLDSYTALQLFVQCTRPMKPSFDLASEAAAVARICQLVEGMPLGIELAATWLKFYSCAQVAQEMADNLDFLTTKLRNVDPRHRSIRAVFEHSWNLLSEIEQQVLRRLAIFRNGFQQPAGEEVAGASFLYLVTLAEKSLLQIAPNDRYQMHELLRQFAEEKLQDDADEFMRVQELHSDFYCTWLHACEVKLQTAASEETLRAIEMEMENVQRAWLWAARQKNLMALSQAMEALFEFYYRRNRLGEGTRLCQVAVQMLHEVTCNSALHLLARLLICQGRLAVVASTYTEAQKHLKESLVLLNQLNDQNFDLQHEQAMVLLLLGHITYSSDLKLTQQYYSQGLALYRTLNNPLNTTNALAALASVQLDLGAVAEAKRLNTECLVLRKQLGMIDAIITSLRDLARCALWTGEFALGKALMKEASVYCEQTENQLQLAYTLDFLGRFAACDCDYPQANIYFDQCIRLLITLDRRQEILYPLYERALIHMSLGNYADMKRNIDEGLSLLRQEELLDMVGYYTFAHACWQIAMRKDAEALQALYKASQSFHKLGEPRGIAQTMAMMAYVVYRLGQPALAQHYVLTTLRTAITLRLHLPLALVLPTLTLLLADQGRLERAIELYALAMCQSYVGKSRYFEQLAGDLLAAAAQQAPTIIATAEAQVQTVDLWQAVDQMLTELPSLGWCELDSPALDNYPFRVS